MGHVYASAVRAQRFDRIEFCRTHRRINSKEETDGGGDTKRNNHRADGGFYRDGSHGTDQGNESIGQGQAHYSAHGGKHGGFGHELQDDVFFSCAQRTAQSDFAGAFGHAGEHDVHDYDTADHQENGSQGYRNSEQIARNLVPQSHDGSRTKNSKIVRGIIGKMTPRAHQHAGLIFGSLHDFGVLSLYKDGQPVVLLMPIFVVGAERKQDVIVLRLAEGAADFGGHTDDFVGVGARPNGLTDRINGGEKFLHHVGADKTYRRVMHIVALGQESAGREIHVTDLSVIGSYTGKIGVFEEDVSGTNVHSVVIGGSHIGRALHIFAEALILLEGDEGAFLGLYPGILTGDDAEAVDQINVGAKIGHPVGDVEIQPRDDAHNRYQGGYRKDYTQKGQETAQLVGAQGIQRQAKGLDDGNGGSGDAAAALAHRYRYSGQTGQTINRSYTQNMASGCYLLRGRTPKRSRKALSNRRVKRGFITCLSYFTAFW